MQEKMKILITGAAGFIGHALYMTLRKRSDSLAVMGVDYKPARGGCVNPETDAERERADAADLYHVRAGEIIMQTRSKADFRAFLSIFRYLGAFDIVEKRISAGEGEMRHLDLSGKKKTIQFLERFQPDMVFHFAALPGVLPSMDNPADYVSHNNGVLANLLEACRACGSVKHLLIASSSSVYGDSKNKREDCPLPPPANIYAATKQMDEDLARLYAGRHGIPVTAMRFFTVYGPYGRADMAVHRAIATAIGRRDMFILNGDGSSTRSFTYIDDVVDAMCRLMPLPPADAEGYFRAVNIGAERSHSVQELIACVEGAVSALPRKGAEELREKVMREVHSWPSSWTSWTGSRRIWVRDLERQIESVVSSKHLPMKVKRMSSNAAEAAHTQADCTLLRELTGTSPQTLLRDGIARTLRWHLDWWVNEELSSIQPISES